MRRDGRCTNRGLFKMNSIQLVPMYEVIRRAYAAVDYTAETLTRLKNYNDLLSEGLVPPEGFEPFFGTLRDGIRGLSGSHAGVAASIDFAEDYRRTFCMALRLVEDQKCTYIVNILEALSFKSPAVTETLLEELRRELLKNHVVNRSDYVQDQIGATIVRFGMMVGEPDALLLAGELHELRISFQDRVQSDALRQRDVTAVLERLGND